MPESAIKNAEVIAIIIKSEVIANAPPISTEAGEKTEMSLGKSLKKRNVARAEMTD